MPDVVFPDKLDFLFTPSRYKVAYGGRGGAKSWSIARALLILGSTRRLRILCARETQKSIADSVHKLLADQIGELGLTAFYTVLKATIIGKNGSEFLFAGLHHNISNIKSVESVDIAWVEEAQTVSKSSWDVLIPTIRKEQSEIWISFNPELDSDDTFRRFVLNPPPNTVPVKVNWSDNPWFPKVLRDEKNHLMEKDYDAYLHVWEGHCKQILEGAVYASELREMVSGERETVVPYDPTKPVHTFWDLGYADSTCIWFAQAAAFQYRIIDYYSNNQKPLNHYLEVLQQRGYIYGRDHLPHDARAKTLGTSRSIEELMREKGRNVSIVPQLSVADGINAARTIFPLCWFDREKCADGLHALRHYAYEKDDDLGTWKKNPLHNWASHGADGFRYLAVALKQDEAPPPQSQYQPQQVGWMY